MDWVQIYAIIWLGLILLASAILDGKKTVKTISFLNTIINIIIMLPFIGRIFGWW